MNFHFMPTLLIFKETQNSNSKKKKKRFFPLLSGQSKNLNFWCAEKSLLLSPVLCCLLDWTMKSEWWEFNFWVCITYNISSEAGHNFLKDPHCLPFLWFEMPLETSIYRVNPFQNTLGHPTSSFVQCDVAIITHAEYDKAVLHELVIEPHVVEQHLN